MVYLQNYIESFYNDKSTDMVVAISTILKEQHDIDLDDEELSDNNTIEAMYGKRCIELTYQYEYQDEQLTSIKVCSTNNDVLDIDVTIEVSELMRAIYKDLMFASHLINEFSKVELLSDEAMSIIDNWKDAI